MPASLTSTDWAYIAGFLDGDGCITTRIQNNGRAIPAIVFYQKDPEVLYWLREALQTSVSVYYVNGSHAIQIAKRSLVREILAGILPYVKVKHQQCLLAIGMIDDPERAQELRERISALQSYTR